MNKKSVSLADIAKKPGSYVTDMETLKASIKKSVDNKTNNKSEADGVSSQNTNFSRNPHSSSQAKAPEKIFVSQATVGLNTPIPKELRDKLKVKAITDGKKMKDVVIDLIREYVEN